MYEKLFDMFRHPFNVVLLEDILHPEVLFINVEQASVYVKRLSQSPIAAYRGPIAT